MGILGGPKIKSPGNVMNCPENRYIFAVGILGDQKNQKSGKCNELPRKVIQKCNPHPTPPGVGSFMCTNFKCLETFHELSRK